MDQLNPYQAPELHLPTATEVSLEDHPSRESIEDLVYGLKLLKTSALLVIWNSLILGCWNFIYAYQAFIQQPLLQNDLSDATYWITSGLDILSEVLAIAGLYWCSTRVIGGVSRMPLLLALILSALFFPSAFYQYALDKPWIYFEGMGNAHAGFCLSYLAYLPGMALSIWLALWMTARGDALNHKRVMTMLFLYTLCVIWVIFKHVIYVEMLAAHPDDRVGIGVYYLFNGLLCVSGIVGEMIARRVYISLLASHQELIKLENTASKSSH
jgi:hypothetical protein